MTSNLRATFLHQVNYIFLDCRKMKRSLQKSNTTEQRGAQFLDTQGKECDWSTFLKQIMDMKVSKMVFLRRNFFYYRQRCLFVCYTWIIIFVVYDICLLINLKKESNFVRNLQAIVLVRISQASLTIYNT